MRSENTVIAYLLRPHNIIVVTVLLSLFAWLFPDWPGLRRGFNQRESITVQGVLILSLWYGFLISCSFVGFHVGRLTFASEEGEGRAPLTTVGPYVVFTALALIGVLYTYGTIAAKGALTAYFANAGHASANMLKEALYEDYSIGPLSLRYAGIISGAIAFYRIMRFGRCGALEALNIALVLAISFLSGRMLLLWTMCGVAGGFTLLRDRKSKRRASRFLWILCLTVVLLLWILNYTRNHLFYEAAGSSSFLQDGLGEALTYLGTPIQVSLGIANHWSASVAGEQPWTLVEYDADTLTTNSALSQLVPEVGWFSIPVIGTQCFIFAALAGWCSRKRGSYFYFGFPVICYGFAELWRLDLFNYGIFDCLTILVFAVPYFVGRGLTVLRPDKILESRVFS